jgi:hypothetical protein
MKKILVQMLAAAILFSLTACGGTKNEKENTWPNRGISMVLPIPDSNKVTIDFDDDDSFSAHISDASEDDFEAYITKCAEQGFTIDSMSSSTEYDAYNEEGYRLNLSYYAYESSKEISIQLDSPKVSGEFTWPAMGLATLIPVPDTSIGTINIDSSTQFNAYIGDMSIDSYNAYVNKCIEKGFVVDYNKDDKLFYADNADGISLRLEYEGFNTIYISMDAPEAFEYSTESISPEGTKEPVTSASPKDTSAPEASADSGQTETDLVDGMRPEFKEAMDSYESFFTEYCNFLQKYQESPGDVSLLADYTTYMTQYTDTMSKMEALGNGDLSDTELKYYIEVTGRITQMLLDSAA